MIFLLVRNFNTRGDIQTFCKQEENAQSHLIYGNVLLQFHQFLRKSRPCHAGVTRLMSGYLSPLSE